MVDRIEQVVSGGEEEGPLAISVAHGDSVVIECGGKPAMREREGEVVGDRHFPIGSAIVRSVNFLHSLA